jgi:hypothetical protein
VYVVPNHVCPVVNLFDSMAVIEGDALVARWRVDARGFPERPEILEERST